MLQPYLIMITAMSITTAFTNNRSQAVRLPADARLPEGVRKVQARARKLDRIISPTDHSWNSFFLDGPMPTEDFMAERVRGDLTETWVSAAA
jgi:antitoxin VapB